MKIRTIATILQDSLDIAPHGGPPQQTTAAASRQELLERFDKHVAAARAALYGPSADERSM